MLPGVWTLPSEQAISPEEAYQTAKECAAANPELSRYLNAHALCTVSIFHYDAAGKHVYTQGLSQASSRSISIRYHLGAVTVNLVNVIILRFAFTSICCTIIVIVI